MNVVMITNGSRPRLLKQALNSLVTNAADISKHTVTLVIDCPDKVTEVLQCVEHTIYPIVNERQRGPGMSRNIGARATKNRHTNLAFIDEDTYMLPSWDVVIEHTLNSIPGMIVAGCAHPFNVSLGLENINGVLVDRAGVLSTVCLAMPWAIHDDVGELVETWGPGASEDVEWCARATQKGYRLCVTYPMCCIHTGLTNSAGGQIVGYDHMYALNRKQIANAGLHGKVVIE